MTIYLICSTEMGKTNAPNYAGEVEHGCGASKSQGHQDADYRDLFPRFFYPMV